MSRIGKEPVALPSGVEVRREGDTLTVTGPNGTLEQHVHPDITITVEDDRVVVERPTDAPDHRALHGLTRALLANMVTGVTDGFTRELNIVGVGYRATAQSSEHLNLQVGYSHSVDVQAPEGVSFEVPSATRVIVKGADKQRVGQAAAKIRAIRPPEPYKGKGIRYVDEHVRRKAGKAAGA